MANRLQVKIALMALLATVSMAGAATEMPPVQQAVARPALQPYWASYKVFRGKKKVGVSKVELTADTDGLFVYRTKVSARGLARLFVRRDITGETRFTLENDLPFPHSYNSIGAKKDDTQRIVFDPSNNEISSEYKGAEKTLPWSPGVLDLLSMEIAMQLQFLRGEVPTEYTLVEKNRIRDYRVEIEGSESIKTPFGEYETIRLWRQRDGSDNHAVIWLAPDLNYLMIRFDKYKRGKKDFSLLLNNYQPAPAN